jgi:hypothetical protein
MQQTEHYQANKKKNIQYEIFLLKKRRPKDSSIYLSTLVLNQVKKERILFWIYDKGSGHEEIPSFL